MKIQSTHKQCGFTILELLTVVAVIGILGAVAVVGYQSYTARARGVEIIEKYDAIRTSVGIRAKLSPTDDCAELARGFDQTNLATSAAKLSYGFEATAGGFRPVLTVCAQAGNGPLGVSTARGTYDTLVKQGVVEKNPVLTDSAVSFALRLTDGDAALCKVASSSPAATGCVAASAATSGTSTAASTAAKAVTGPASAAVATCPAGQALTAFNAGGTWQRVCAPTSCPAGQKVSGSTHQCVAISGGQTVSTGSALAALPLQTQQLAQAAEQKLSQSIGSATTMDAAISATLTATQGLPPAALTQSIPGNSPLAKQYRATCNLPTAADGACADRVVGNYCASTQTSATPSCTLAIMCTKSIGLCQGVTPEMKRLFDDSMQRIVNDWFAAHPACTTFGQTGC